MEKASLPQLGYPLESCSLSGSPKVRRIGYQSSEPLSLPPLSASSLLLLGFLPPSLSYITSALASELSEVSVN